MMPSKKRSSTENRKEEPRKHHKQKPPKDGGPGSSKTQSPKARRQSTAKDDKLSPSPSTRSPGYRESSLHTPLSKEAALSDEEESRTHRHSALHFSPHTDIGSKDVALGSPPRLSRHTNGQATPAPKIPTGKKAGAESTGRAFPELACAPESLQVKSLPPGRRLSTFRKASEESELYRHFTQEIDRITETTKSRIEGDTLRSDVKKQRSKERKASRASAGPPKQPNGEVKDMPDRAKMFLQRLRGTVPAGENIGIRSKRGGLCAACAVFALLLAVVSVVLIYALKPKTTFQYGCTSTDCVKFNESLTRLLNLSVDPCVDFYSYVCDSWIATSSESFRDVVVNSFYRAVNATIMKSTKHEEDPYGMEGLVHLYRSCYRFMSTGTVFLQDMAKTSLSFLPYTEMMKSKDLPELWGYLVEVAITRGAYATFSMRYLYVGRRPTLHVISEKSIQGKIREVYIHVIGHRHASNASVPYFEDYVADVLQAFYKEADVRQHAELLSRWDSEFDAILQTRGSGRYMPFRNLVQLTNMPALEHYMKIINKATPERLHMTMETEIYVEGLEQIANTSALSRHHALQWQCVYYIIHLVTGLLRYAYLRQHLSASQETIDRTCVIVTEATLGHTWLYAVTRMVGHPGEAKRVKVIGETVKDAAIRSAESWMDSFTKSLVSSYVRNITIFTYEESELRHAVASVNYTTFVHDEDEDFSHYYWKLRRFEKMLVYQQIIPEQHIAVSRLQVLAKLAYENKYRLLAVPTAFQRPPLYYIGTALPFYVNSATVGTLIARELIRSAALHSTWSSKTQNKLITFLACLKDVQGSLGLQTQLGADEGAWNRSAFFWTYGSRIIHDLVRDTIQKESGHDFQKNWDAAQSMFFIRYCMMFCSSQPLLDEPLLPREQCLIPLHSNPAFSEHYKCATKKSAVPGQSCISSLFT